MNSEDYCEEPKISAGGRVYAVVYSDGWVKVGRGRNPDIRIKAHNKISKMRGAHLVNKCVSGLILRPSDAEKRLIDFCASSGQLSYGKEWFTGVNFGDLEDLISSEFPGDSTEDLIQASAKLDEDSRKFLDYAKEFLGFDSFERMRWRECNLHASVMHTICMQSGYDDPRLIPAKNGYSQFAYECPLALYSMSREEIAMLYVQVSIDPLGALNLMGQRTEKLVNQFREDGVI